MSLLGNAALAMWWDISDDMRPEFEDWHSHEHFPERLGIPGFRRASRWRSATGGEGIFVMYELEAYETLSSPQYLTRLNAPTPWSTKLMPHHRNMVRSQCHVLQTRGAGVAAHALTVRLSPEPGKDERLQGALKTIIDSAPMRPGLTGAHLLKHQRPAIAATTEQKIRGGDQEADWVLVATGYDARVLSALAASELAPPALVQQGAIPGAVSSLYNLSYAAIPQDVSAL